MGHGRALEALDRHQGRAGRVVHFGDLRHRRPLNPGRLVGGQCPGDPRLEPRQHVEPLPVVGIPPLPVPDHVQRPGMEGDPEIHRVEIHAVEPLGGYADDGVGAAAEEELLA